MVIDPVPLFILTSYSFYTKVILILILMLIIYKMLFFSTEEGQNGQNHCSSDTHHPIKDKKRYSFQLTKQQKNHIGSVWDFPQPATLFCSRWINPYFKINIAFFCCPPLFSKNISIFGSVSKNENNCVNSHLNPFIGLKNILGIEAFDSLGLYPFPETFLNVLLKLDMPP